MKKEKKKETMREGEKGKKCLFTSTRVVLIE